MAAGRRCTLPSDARPDGCPRDRWQAVRPIAPAVPRLALKDLLAQVLRIMPSGPIISLMFTVPVRSAAIRRRAIQRCSRTGAGRKAMSFASITLSAVSEMQEIPPNEFSGRPCRRG